MSCEGLTARVVLFLAALAVWHVAEGLPSHVNIDCVSWPDNSAQYVSTVSYATNALRGCRLHNVNITIGCNYASYIEITDVQLEGGFLAFTPPSGSSELSMVSVLITSSVVKATMGPAAGIVLTGDASVSNVTLRVVDSTLQSLSSPIASVLSAVCVDTFALESDTNVFRLRDVWIDVDRCTLRAASADSQTFNIASIAGVAAESQGAIQADISDLSVFIRNSHIDVSASDEASCSAVVAGIVASGVYGGVTASWSQSQVGLLWTHIDAGSRSAGFAAVTVAGLINGADSLGNLTVSDVTLLTNSTTVNISATALMVITALGGVASTATAVSVTGLHAYILDTQVQMIGTSVCLVASPAAVTGMAFLGALAVTSTSSTSAKVEMVSATVLIANSLINVSSSSRGLNPLTHSGATAMMGIANAVSLSDTAFGRLSLTQPLFELFNATMNEQHLVMNTPSQGTFVATAMLGGAAGYLGSISVSMTAAMIRSVGSLVTTYASTPPLSSLGIFAMSMGGVASSFFDSPGFAEYSNVSVTLLNSTWNSEDAFSSQGVDLMLARALTGVASAFCKKGCNASFTNSRLDFSNATLTTTTPQASSATAPIFAVAIASAVVAFSNGYSAFLKDDVNVTLIDSSFTGTASGSGGANSAYVLLCAVGSLCLGPIASGSARFSRVTNVALSSSVSVTSNAYSTEGTGFAAAGVAALVVISAGSSPITLQSVAVHATDATLQVTGGASTDGPSTTVAYASTCIGSACIGQMTSTNITISDFTVVFVDGSASASNSAVQLSESTKALSSAFGAVGSVAIGVHYNTHLSIRGVWFSAFHATLSSSASTSNDVAAVVLGITVGVAGGSGTVGIDDAAFTAIVGKVSTLATAGMYAGFGGRSLACSVGVAFASFGTGATAPLNLVINSMRSSIVAAADCSVSVTSFGTATVSTVAATCGGVALGRVAGTFTDVFIANTSFVCSDSSASVKVETQEMTATGSSALAVAVGTCEVTSGGINMRSVIAFVNSSTLRATIDATDTTGAGWGAAVCAGVAFGLVVPPAGTSPPVQLLLDRFLISSTSSFMNVSTAASGGSSNGFYSAAANAVVFGMRWTSATFVVSNTIFDSFNCTMNVTCVTYCALNTCMSAAGAVAVLVGGVASPVTGEVVLSVSNVTLMLQASTASMYVVSVPQQLAGLSFATAQALQVAVNPATSSLSKSDLHITNSRSHVTGCGNPSAENMVVTCANVVGNPCCDVLSDGALVSRPTVPVNPIATSAPTWPTTILGVQPMQPPVLSTFENAVTVRRNWARVFRWSSTASRSSTVSRSGTQSSPSTLSWTLSAPTSMSAENASRTDSVTVKDTDTASRSTSLQVSASSTLTQRSVTASRSLTARTASCNVSTLNLVPTSSAADTSYAWQGGGAFLTLINAVFTATCAKSGVTLASADNANNNSVVKMLARTHPWPLTNIGNTTARIDFGDAFANISSEVQTSFSLVLRVSFAAGCVQRPHDVAAMPTCTAQLSVTYVAPPPAAVPVAVQGTALAGSVSAAVVGSTANLAFAARVSAVQAILDCNTDGVKDPLDVFSSPLQLSISDDPTHYHIGALVGDAVLLCIFIACHVSVGVGYWFVTTRTQPRYSLAEALAWARFPSVSVFPVVYLLPTFVGSGWTVMLYADAGGLRALGAFVLIAVLVLAAFTARLLLMNSEFHARFEWAPRRYLDGLSPRALFVWLVSPRGEWIDLKSGRRSARRQRGSFTRRFDLLFADFHGKWRHFLLIDVGVTLAIASLQALMTASTCNTVQIVLLILLVGYPIMLLVIQPHESRYVLFSTTVLGSLQCASGIIAIATSAVDPTSDTRSNLDTASVAISAVTVVFLVLFSLFGVVRAVTRWVIKHLITVASIARRGIGTLADQLLARNAPTPLAAGYGVDMDTLLLAELMMIPLDTPEESTVNSPLATDLPVQRVGSSHEVDAVEMMAMARETSTQHSARISPAECVVTPPIGVSPTRTPPVHSPTSRMAEIQDWMETIKELRQMKADIRRVMSQ